MSECTNLKGHTKTPWRLFVGKHSNLVEILDARGDPIVGWNGFDDSRRSFEEHKANATLIVTSVNEHASLKKGNEALEKRYNDMASQIIDETTRGSNLGIENATLKRENGRLLLLEAEIKKMLTPNPNFKGTLPSWEPIKALLTAEEQE